MAKRLIALLLMVVVIFVSGCTGSPEQTGNPNKDEEGETVNHILNERQRGILKKMGLPTDYEALSLSQKSAIDSIETMLCYLEKTYGGEFVYLGYVAAGSLEKEHLLAYPAEGTEEDVVTLYRTYVNGSFVYEDDYASVQAKPTYEKAVKAFAAEYFANSRVRVYVDYFALREGAGLDNILKDASATVFVFVSDGVYTQEDVDTFAEAAGKWLQDNCGGMPGSVTVLLTKDSAFDRIVPDNYLNKLREDIFVSKIECAVNSEGELTVY